MKKRIITLLAILALLVTCAVFSVNAANTLESHFKSASWTCPSCNAAGNTITWTTWGTDYNDDGKLDYSLTASDDCAHYIMHSSNPSTGRTIEGTGKIVVVITDEDGSAANINMPDSANQRFMTVSGGQKVYIVGNNATINTACEGGATGGAFNVEKGSELHLSGTLTVQRVSGGDNEPTYGGMIRVNNSKVTIGEGVTVKGIDVANQGGAVYAVTNSTLELNGGSIVGGSANRGGAVYLSTSTFNMTSGTITGGTLTGSNPNGGAVFLSSSTMNMSNGTITAVASTSGNDGLRLQSSELNMSGGEIISTGSRLGSGVCLTASTKGEPSVLTLSGNATVRGPESAADRYINNIQIIYNVQTYSRVQADKNWRGRASMTVGESVNSPLKTSGASSAIVANTFVAGTGANNTDFVQKHGTTGDRMVSEHSTHPFLNNYGSTNTIMSRTQVIKADGSYEWYVDNDEAIEKAANKAGWFVRPWTTRSMDGGRKITGGNVYVDVSKAVPSGFDVDDGSKLFLFNAAGTANGTPKTVKAADVAEEFTFAPDGGVYVTVPSATAGSVEVHKVDVSSVVDTVTLRPSANGLYFGAKTTLSGNEDAQAIAAQYLKTGVAVSLSEISKLSDTAWTQDEALQGKGIVVKNILVDGGTIEDGSLKDRSDVPIYAEACVTTADGKLVYLSDANKSITMDSLMTQMNSLYSGFDSQKQLDLANFYQKWLKKYPELWPGLTNIPETAA